MRKLIGWFSGLALAVTACATCAETFPSSQLVFRHKFITARADGAIDKLNLRTGEVFLWDEFAASVNPEKNVRPEFGRCYTDFAGAIVDVLVEPGQTIKMGDAIYKCRFLEIGYASCTVPSTALGEQPIEDRPLRATLGDRQFDAKVHSAKTEGNMTTLYVLIYNTHDHRVWHLTPGQSVMLHL